MVSLRTPLLPKGWSCSSIVVLTSSLIRGVSALFQNGHHFSILLFTCKLAPVASFKGKYSFEFKFKNDSTRANLQVNKRKLKRQPFWKKLYGYFLEELDPCSTTLLLELFSHHPAFFLYLFRCNHGVEHKVWDITVLADS